MNQAVKAMGGEPWCFHITEVAVLTDFQILDFYLNPAAKRAEELRKQSNPDAPLGLPTIPAESAEPAFDPNQPPPRQAIVGAYIACGVPEKVAVAQYEKQLAAWRASQGVT